MEIRVGHSPDPDDAFMFYGVASGRLRMEGYELIQVLEDIESLNRRALRGELEVTALSAHAYAHASDKYYLLSAGSSMGMGYGPILVSRRPLSPRELGEGVIGIPGRLTTAYLLLRMAVGEFKSVELRFDEVAKAVAEGRVDAGLLIHEGQLTYRDAGLVKVLDLWEWWEGESHGLPLPLGLDASRRELGREFALGFAQLLRGSIRYALANREEALDYAAQYARGASRSIVDGFVAMYVNDLTLDVGDRGRRALEFLYESAAGLGVTPRVALEVV